jgi:hypothetical protein
MNSGEDMNSQTIIEQIDSEISRLQQIRELLQSTEVKKSTEVKNGPNRSVTSRGVSRNLVVKPGKRAMSDEAKASIAAAQKKRWAKSKRAEKKAAKVKAAQSVKRRISTSKDAAEPVKIAASVKVVKSPAAAKPVEKKAPAKAAKSIKSPETRTSKV